MGEICEGYVRDEVRDESLGTPLNKGLLLKNVRDDGNVTMTRSIRAILQSSGLEQAGGIGLSHTSEVGEHLHEIARIASAQDDITHRLACLRLQGSTLGKDIGDVHSQHLRPQITVVAGGIATSPDVVEVAGIIARRYLGIKQTDLPSPAAPLPASSSPYASLFPPW